MKKSYIHIFTDDCETRKGIDESRRKFRIEFAGLNRNASFRLWLAGFRTKSEFIDLYHEQPNILDKIRGLGKTKQAAVLAWLFPDAGNYEI